MAVELSRSSLELELIINHTRGSVGASNDVLAAMNMTKFILNALRWARDGYGLYNGGYSGDTADVHVSLCPSRWARFNIHTGEIVAGSMSFDYGTLERYLSRPVYLANAFSLQMLSDKNSEVEIDVVDSIPLHLDSAIGHQDTAAVLCVPMNRKSISLKKGDTLYVAQLVGGRLPEGCTTLPEGFSFKFYRVYLKDISV